MPDAKKTGRPTGRAASPVAKAAPGPAKKVETTAAAGALAAAAATFEFPPRPAFLRWQLLFLYLALDVVVIFFSYVGESMRHDIPEGKYKLRNGTLTSLADYDAAALGPFPKCHPHFDEHEATATAEDGTTHRHWAKNADAPKGGPYPAGHPEQPEFVARIDAMAKKENAENRFTWVGLQPNLHLLALATILVYIGSKHGVWLYTEPAETRSVDASAAMMQTSDAYWFPVMGSCVLFGLFVVLKYIGSDWIKLAITCGIVLMCTFGVGTNVDHFFALARNLPFQPLFTLPYFDQAVTLMELVGLASGAAMAIYFVLAEDKSDVWIVNNIFGASFCIMGIKTMGIPNYKTGAIMLVGLFFYDVFWVFGSKSIFGANVMVSVAKGVEAPIKLMFPRSFGGCGTLAHSMLGLGDIVVPGIFIAFLAKWDAYKIGQKSFNSFIYLNVTMVAYVLSLVTTVSIMLFFNAAQPALLYIVPFVLIASLGVAVVRGELKELLAFEMSDEQEPAQDSAKKDD